MNDTITAIATPPGEGALAIVRLSGRESIAIADKAFKGEKLLRDTPAGSVRFGRISDENGTLIDEALVTVMREPHSYTGEDTIEISCHGGYIPSSRILKTLLKLGAREAERGEFTLRAFLNNRIDLTRAEAVADIVSSRSDLRYEAALNQLSGKLSKRIEPEIDKLKELLSHAELGIDFAEEGIELSSRESMNKKISDLISGLSKLAAGYDSGKIIKEGYQVAIAGKVNVGKSSLLNCLLDSDRAIVNDTPGTTRDSITETIIINGLEVHLTDTAGFRGQAEAVESEGIRRACEIVAASDMTIALLDPASGITDHDGEVFDTVGDSPRLVVLNKRDLYNSAEWDEVRQNLPLKTDISISALTGDNIDGLKQMIFDRATEGGSNVGYDSVIVSRRHHQGLTGAIDQLGLALTSNQGDEILAEHLRLALNRLGEITGEVTSEELLNSIFDNFCIGK